jgi:hypothetical protein
LPIGVGDIDHTVTLLPGGSITFVISLGNVFLPVANTASIVVPEWVVDPDLSNNQSTVVLGPPQQAIFSDGFESGDVSAWASKSAGGLAVLAGAALEGHYGLQVTASRSGAAVVRDATPNREGAYHARFRFDPNGFGTPAAGTASRRPASRTVLLSGRAQGAAGPRFELVLHVEGGKLFLIGRAATDSGTLIETARAAVADVPHVIDVGWRRSDGPDANDGLFLFQIDGSPAGSLPALDNDAGGGVDSVELGLAISGIRPPPGAHRTVFVDSFESWRLQPEPAPGFARQ